MGADKVWKDKNTIEFSLGLFFASRMNRFDLLVDLVAALNGTKKRKDGLKEDLVRPRVRHEGDIVQRSPSDWRVC